MLAILWATAIQHQAIYTQYHLDAIGSAADHWRSLHDPLIRLDGQALVSPGVLPDIPGDNAPAPLPKRPDVAIEAPNVGIELVDDSIDEERRWWQRLRVVVKPGGTLAEISEAIYGDASHVDELLAIARQQNPHVQRPQQLRVGDAIDVKVDPTTTYVVKDLKWNESEGKLTKVFFNGARETIYLGTSDGLLRIVDFPTDERAQSFSFKLDNDEMLNLKPGTRLAEYAYRPGDAFEDVVREIYGRITASALQDFILQTRWTADQWPPSPSDKKIVIVSTSASWDDTRPASSGYPEERIVTNARYRDLMQRRSEVGIYPLAREGIGTLYRLEIVDPTLTAKGASRLLYGSTDRYLAIAAQAGISPTRDASGKISETFDPPLLGRRFDVYVNYDEEWFVLDEPAYDARSGRTVTRLINGTIIEEYDQAFRHQEGPQRAIYYPTGYKVIVYRTNEAVYTALDFLFFIANGLKYDPNSDAERARAQYFAANLLWNWAPGMPREAGDNPEAFDLIQTDDGKAIEVIIGPKVSSGLVPLVFYEIWTANPCLGALAIVSLATIIILVVGLLLRRKGEA